MLFFEIAFGWCRGLETGRPGEAAGGGQFGKASLVFASEVWIRAHGQATGCVTRQFETGNLGSGRLGKAVEAGRLERQFWFGRLESG